MLFGRSLLNAAVLEQPERTRTFGIPAKSTRASRCEARLAIFLRDSPLFPVPHREL